MDGINMDEDAIFEQLEELARRLGLGIRCEPISLDEEMVHTAGGLCVLRGERLLLINSKARVKDKIKVFVRALSNFDLDHIYIRPAIRELFHIAATHRRVMAVPKPGENSLGIIPGESSC